MSIKQKIKSVWNKVKCKTDDKSKNDKSDCDGDFLQDKQRNSRGGSYTGRSFPRQKARG